MFDADVNAFFDETTTDALVDDESEGSGRDVVNDSSATVVELVRHTLMDRTVSLDINEITDLVGDHVSGQLGGSMFAELASEHVTSASAITMRMRHLKKGMG